MAENANEVFLLCDSTKIEKDSFVNFAPISILDYIITDKNLDSKLISKYKTNGVNIISEKIEKSTTSKALL